MQHVTSDGVPTGATVTQVQNVLLQDFDPPRFQQALPSVVRVPFFAARSSTPTIPIVEKRTTAFFKAQGFNYPLSLSSVDGSFV